MNKRTKVTSVLALCAMVSSAQALEIDFIDLTENSKTGLGESAWKVLTLSDTEITADITASGFAYLDWGIAGLGDCSALLTGATMGANLGSGANLCNPGSDDNVTTGESVTFAFNTTVDVEFWFNNNHDGGFSNGDLINVGGTNVVAQRGYLNDENGSGIFRVNAGELITISYVNEEFYLSGFAATGVVLPAEVSAPGVLSLLGISLFGLGFTQRRRVVSL